MRIKTIIAAVVLSFSLAQVGLAAVAYNEGADLSDNQSVPTSVLLGFGSNTVTGSLRVSSPGDAQDWIAVTIPLGMSLDQIVNTAYSGDSLMFTGFQNGSSFVGSPGSAGSYNGYTHLGAATVGTNVLPAMGSAAGTISNFTPPLPGGTYTFLLQQTGGTATTYGVDFSVTPEPAGLAMLLLSGVYAATCRRRGMTR